jgi:hypothetical protein
MKKKSDKYDKLPVSFIVRIYRLSGEGPEGMAGVVEAVEEGEEEGFIGIRELVAIIGGELGMQKKPGS